MIEFEGNTYTVTGGDCGVFQYPPDFGGGSAFGLSVGTPSIGSPGGPDYFGLLAVDLADAAAPDGTYPDVRATASVGGEGFNIRDVTLTIEGGGTRGSFVGTTAESPTRPIQGTFEC